jgi:type IV secretory pathway TrbF-like protein
MWFAMYWSEILANLKAIGSNWISIFFGALLVAISSFAIVKWQTRKRKPPAIV